MEKLKAYLERGLELFEIDPASSDYQRGYEASMQDTLEVLERFEKTGWAEPWTVVAVSASSGIVFILGLVTGAAL